MNNEMMCIYLCHVHNSNAVWNKNICMKLFSQLCYIQLNAIIICSYII